MSSLALPSVAAPAASELRDWQRAAIRAMSAWRSGPFLISAAPGAGKTRPALQFASGELARGACDGVVIVCPTAPLTRQWARAAHGLGLDLLPDADSPRPPAGFHGVVVTYARVAQAPVRWAAGCRPGTLVVADEAHHLGEELAWGESFARAFAQAARWLLLSGTPFRSDATAIPGVSYDAHGLAEPDVAYTYADAVRDAVCRPVAFVTYDGALSWRSGDDVIESNFETVLSGREASRRYRTAISTELPDGLPRILAEAHTRLMALRAGTSGLAPHPDAGGLVIAADSEHARRIAAQLRRILPPGAPAPVVVLHAEARAAEKLAAFTRSADPWIVAVNMVSEGVDIPRLRVGVYATAAKTPLVFRQIVGRFVRTIPGRALEPSWLYVPADPILRDHAANVREEISVVRRRPGEDDGAAEAELDERPDRRENEPSAVLDFEPLSADVAPQMSLFGDPSSPAAPPAAAWPIPSDPVPAVPVSPTLSPTASGPSTHPAPAIPAYERRARLRKQRHRLISDLARRERRSHQDLNAELNRELRIDSVDTATLEQLQASIDLLERRLSPRRR